MYRNVLCLLLVSTQIIAICLLSCLLLQTTARPRAEQSLQIEGVYSFVIQKSKAVNSGKRSGAQVI